MKQAKETARVQKRFTVEITEKDIERAKRNDSYICVVSQAIARCIPDATRIETDTQSIRFTRQGQRLVYLTPYAVQGYVIAFDAGDPIQPFSFQLRDPAKVQTRRPTARGRVAVAAYNRVKSHVRRKARASGRSLTDPEVVADMRDAATAAYAEAAAPNDHSERMHEPKGEGRVKSPPRVFRRKQRSYGHRLLRINQQEAG
jgi:hypothetical protein